MKKIILIVVLFFGAKCFSQKNVFDVARSGTIEELKTIVVTTPDVINTKNDAGYSPLILACYNGNTAIARYLIAHVSNINGSSSYGTPLMAAVVKKNVEIIKLLLAKNANPNLADANGTTALIYATMFQSEDIVKLLCDVAVINIAHKDNKGFSALDYANKLKNDGLIKILKQNKL